MSLIRPMAEEYASYLFDESRTMGSADWICFPQTEEEIVEAVRFANARNLPVTAQGALTGLAGGRESPGRPDPQPLAHEPHPGAAPGRGFILSARAAGARVAAASQGAFEQEIRSFRLGAIPALKRFVRSSPENCSSPPIPPSPPPASAAWLPATPAARVPSSTAARANTFMLCAPCFRTGA